MLRQSLQQKLQQKLSPQQIQLMQMIQLPTMELEQRIKEEMEINPALEEGRDDSEDTKGDDDYENNDEEEKDQENSRDDFNLDQYIDDDEIPAYKLTVKNTGPDDDRKEIPFAGGTTFQETLVTQLNLRNLNERQQMIAAQIIGNLDNAGYLTRDLDAMIDDLAFTQNVESTKEELEFLLKEIQDLDPAGVGARNLQECLLLQLNRKPHRTEAQEMAIRIVQNAMDEFTHKRYDKIAKLFELNEQQLKSAIGEIIKLNPKPGNAFADNQKNLEQVVPDFTITNSDGVLELTLNGRNAPELKVSREYKEMMQHYAKSKNNTKADKEAILFVKQKIDSAHWFVDAILQRQQTMMYTMNAIMNYQKEYFLEGDETKLKPMILKDIAEITGLDVSTISRVSSSKYVQTEFGTTPLKYFFSEALQNDSGEEVSTREVKQILMDSVAEENKREPLTDDQLVAALKQKGYTLARRTITKYREQLDIPVARLRKEL